MFTAQEIEALVTEGEDLRGLDFTGMDFTGANLTGANMGQCILTNANFTNANLERANLSYCFANGSNFSSARLVAANLNDSFFTNATFTSCDLSKVNAFGVNMGSTYAPACRLYCADFRCAALFKTNFAFSDMRGLRLAGADIRETVFGATLCAGKPVWSTLDGL